MAGEPPRLRVEPFDPERHDRSGFESGSRTVDNYLARTAKKLQAGDYARVFVAAAPGSDAVAGFYALNAHTVSLAEGPELGGRAAPRSGDVPAVLIAMLGVDRRSQGRGVGRFLLVDALLRCLDVSSRVGVRAVVLDVLAEGGEAAQARRTRFYEAMGFRAFAARPSRLFLPLSVVRRLRDG